MRQAITVSFVLSLWVIGCAVDGTAPTSREAPPPAPSPPPASPPASYSDGGTQAPPDRSPDAGSVGSMPPPGGDTDVANRWLMADARAFAAECRCFFMEYGFSSAAECTTEAMATLEAPVVDCVATAFAGRSEIAECLIAADDGYATCMQTAECTATTCDDAADAAMCGVDEALEAALDACFAG